MLSQKTKARQFQAENSSVSTLFGQWKDEDRELERSIDDVRNWMNAVSQIGFPKFGETAGRLAGLREQLVRHFEREDEIGEQLTEHYRVDSEELAAIRRQAERDHRHLINGLENLIGRLDEVDPPFRSWEAAVDEVEAFVVSLEHHEDQETDSVEALLPKPLD